MVTETHHREAGWPALISAVLLLVGIFAVDWVFPVGFAVGVLYVTPVLITLRRLRVSVVLSIAAAASVLTVVGFAQNSMSDPFTWIGPANRGLAIFAIWATAVLGVRFRRASERLRASESHVRAIVDTAVDAIITIDSRGIVRSFNHAAERMFGYAASEVVGQNVKLLMPSPYRDEHDDYLRRYLATGEARIIGIGRP